MKQRSLVISPHVAATTPETAETRALQRALAQIAGHSRVLLYDVPATDAPRRLDRSGVAVQAPPRWHAYLRNRRAFDDGRLTLLIALRRLPPEEELLVVDWGAAYANTFLLLEPSAEDVDLTDAGNPIAREVAAAARTADRDAETTLVRLLRGIYASWVYWPAAPAAPETSRRVDLPLRESDGSILQHLDAVLRGVYPPSRLRSHLIRLLREESELFTGRTVERARSPFLTRLGLPKVYDPSAFTEVLRHLVNEGYVSVRAADGQYSFKGPEAPIPDGMPNELVERLLL
jgi:hypothetical protein